MASQIREFVMFLFADSCSLICLSIKRPRIQKINPINPFFLGISICGWFLSDDILARMTIKAIIFDLGGVLLRTTDFSRRELLAARLGMTHPELEELIFWGESGSKAQRGEISVKQHLEYVRSVLNLSQEKFKEVIDTFFADDALDYDLVDYIRSLHCTYKTALLSNAANDLRKQIAEKWHFEDAFDTMVISGEVGMVKPDPQIYRLTLDRLRVQAGEVVFVDDVQPNVDAAVRVGMQGIRFRDAMQVRQDLAALLVEH